MDNVQFVVLDEQEFWKRLKAVVEEVVASQAEILCVARDEEQRLLKMEDVCSYFQVSRPTVYEWLRAGKLRSIKIKARRFFRWEDVKLLLEEATST